MISHEVNNTEFTCTWCGEVNHTFVDPSQGQEQEYFPDYSPRNLIVDKAN